MQRSSGPSIPNVIAEPGASLRGKADLVRDSSVWSLPSIFLGLFCLIPFTILGPPFKYMCETSSLQSKR
jgi:hypothetical protein